MRGEGNTLIVIVSREIRKKFRSVPVHIFGVEYTRISPFEVMT